MKRRVLTSVFASMVLVGVLSLSGCGGSNAGACCQSGVAATEKADGGFKTLVVSKEGSTKHTFEVKGKDSSGKENSTVASGELSKCEKDGKPACTKASDGCSLQVSICGSKCASREEGDQAYNNGDAKNTLDYVKNYDGDNDNYGYDPTTDAIVYGGTIEVDANGFDHSDLTIDVKSPAEGEAIKPDGTHITVPFANPGDKVFVVVKKGGEIVKTTTVMDTMDESGNFTIHFDDIDLSGDDVQVEFYSITDAAAAGATGTTGATGSTGAGN